MPSNEEVIRAIQKKALEVFERHTENGKTYDSFKTSWKSFATSANPTIRSEEALSSFTTKEIQDAVVTAFGTDAIKEEKSIGHTQLKFDLWNKIERTSFEICLGAI